MGNWRDRHRRYFRKQNNPWSVTRKYDNEPPLEVWKHDGVPLWEKKFCTEIGYVPWRKIVDTKKFIDYHVEIRKWDDSACEEAFHNAKRRYWEEINGHQCEINLPDPDIYIERIDWNPEIDPKMVEELDRAYFAPEVGQDDVLLECKNEKTRNYNSVSEEGHIDDPDHVDNPWEHGIKCIENKGQGWSQWNCSDSGRVDNDGNPWDSYITRENRGIMDNAWGVQLSNLGNGGSHFNVSTVWGMSGSKAWNEGHQGVKSWNNKGLGCDARNNVWGSNNHQGTSNFDQYNNKPWNNNYNRNGRIVKDRIRPISQGNQQDWKYQDNYCKRPKDAEFEKTGRWGSRNHASQKGEGPHGYVSSQSYSRPQRDDYQRNGSWQR